MTLAVTTTPLAWPKNKELADKSRMVRAALGLHPQLVSERYSEISLFEKYVRGTRFIGEVGLDATPQFYSSLGLQLKAFERILKICSESGGKILSVHSRFSTKETLTLIENCFPTDRGTVVLHWFGGTRSELERAVGIGCYFSINLQMLSKEAQRKMVTMIPLSRILTETDGPFTFMSNHPSRPKDVAATLSRLASVLELDEEHVRNQIVSNLRFIEKDE